MNDKLNELAEMADRKISDVVRREYPEVSVWPHTRVTSIIRDAIIEAVSGNAVAYKLGYEAGLHAAKPL